MFGTGSIANARSAPTFLPPEGEKLYISGHFACVAL
jgi:hypothetical protein